ncbi:MAG TPA: hypothetical protein VLR26_05435 [Frankiaceae bacterium]|nr:hypothetical protein [Frankiaceae bacterium]
MSESAPDGVTGDGGKDGGAVPSRPGDRRRLIQRAIRNREPAPEGLEDLAMQVALRQTGLRWFVVLYAIGFVVEGASIFLENHTSTRIRDGVIAVLFLLLGYQQWRVGQRAKDAVDRWSA